MRRKIDEALRDWKASPDRKSLVIFGARQVGKTYSVRDFAKSYNHFLEINFETDGAAMDAFEGDLGTDALVSRLRLKYSDKPIEPGETLIFLDEIQLCPRAFSSLKPFTDDGRYHVVASGSGLGSKYRRETSYPVGYADIMTMRSMDFEEYLWAMRTEEAQIDAVKRCLRDVAPIDEFALSVLNERFRDHMIVGGMPECVASFARNGDYRRAREIQEAINRMYLEDIGKYASVADKSKAAKCFRSIPVQLSKDNKKFMYSELDGGTNANGRTYGAGIDWLIDAHLVVPCYNLREPRPPLAMNAERSSFKLFYHDTGLLMSMMEPQTAWSVLMGDVRANKGALAENAVSEALAKNGVEAYHFTKKAFETDFVVPMDRGAAVIEVKSGNNTKAKAIPIAMSEKYGVERGMILENSNVSVDDAGVEHYPLFAASFIRSMERFGWADLRRGAGDAGRGDERG
ncbi:MAG: AAA family ATPase [Candidatus Methanoplasma sp.]|jgi:predicted AAA+ superfamily ATPase|nr:AAA family ATPase [Candidatus Methanoplasma sp.]